MVEGIVHFLFLINLFIDLQLNLANDFLVEKDVD